MVLMNSAKPYVAAVGDTQKILLDHDIVRAWTYMIILATLLFPEVLTIMYSFYRIVMKPETRINLSSYLWVSSSAIVRNGYRCKYIEIDVHSRTPISIKRCFQSEDSEL